MFAAVVDSAAHYLAQYIISALIAGQDAVGDGKRRRARVVGDHATGKLLAFGQSLVNTHQIDNNSVSSPHVSKGSISQGSIRNESSHIEFQGRSVAKVWCRALTYVRA